ncbi:MAG: DUF4320 family protein [Oscillospiraceae bacterium]|nr:DUF4320 family protein [Oscillospiraceae bacterium]
MKKLNLFFAKINGRIKIRLFHRLKCEKGESYVETAIFCWVVILVMSFFLSVTPVFFTKLSLDNYAHELIREAEIAGRVDAETTRRLNRLNELKGLNPNVSWNRNGRVQIGEEITVTVSSVVDMGFFTFGSFPVEIVSEASGVSEVLWK